MGTRSLSAVVSWIPELCGGRKHPAYVGMRPNVRWQRFVREWTEGSWDAEVAELAERNGRAEVVLCFAHEAQWPDGLEIPGELFELLDGNRVIAVGKVVAATGS